MDCDSASPLEREGAEGDRKSDVRDGSGDAPEGLEFFKFFLEKDMSTHDDDPCASPPVKKHKK